MKLRFMEWMWLGLAALSPMAGAGQVTNSNAPPAAIVKVEEVKAAEPEVAEEPSEVYTNGLGMVLVRVPGGYWAGKFDVTQKEFQKVMGSNPSAFVGEGQPVDSVNWTDAMEFCRKLTANEISELELPAGYQYTLPSEDQWE